MQGNNRGKVWNRKDGNVKTNYNDRRVSDKKDFNSKLSRTNNEEGAESTAQKSLKKRLRDTERLLKKKSLNAEVRVNMERQLKSLKIQLENEVPVNEKKVRKEDKYFKIKFVETKKVTRKLTKLNKLLEQETEDEKIDSIQLQILENEVDLNYIKYFPYPKYVSLFPNQNSNYDEEGDEEEKQVEESKESQNKSDLIRNQVKEDIREKLLEGKLPKFSAKNPTKKKKVIQEVNKEEDIEQDAFFTSNPSKKAKVETEEVKEKDLKSESGSEEESQDEEESSEGEESEGGEQSEGNESESQSEEESVKNEDTEEVSSERDTDSDE